VQLIRGIQNLSSDNSGLAVTIGNFDGVHVGHREIFSQLRQSADKHNMQACVVTFSPLPHEYFRPDTSAPRLSSLRDKIEAISACGIDKLVFLPFGRKLASVEPEAFIDEYLIKSLQVRHLVVGDDFRFGNQRRGDFEMLVAAGKENGFTVINTPSVTTRMDGTSADSELRISSSAIRKALTNNDLVGASRLLGHPYRISGRVIRGQQLGRTIGFPTANVCLKSLRPALRGVYAVTATVAPQNDKKDAMPTVFNGVANLGERPTVNGRQLLLEVNVLEGNPDLYEQILRVSFHKFLRAEQKFDSLDDLKQAIANDAANAREYFATNNPNDSGDA